MQTPLFIVCIGFKAEGTITDAYHERYTAWHKKFTQYARNIELELMRKVLSELEDSE